MIYALIALLALAVLAPLLLVLRASLSTRGVRELALDLHATQLRELDRDLAEGRILAAEHKTAMLEVQRRILAAAATQETATRAGARWPVLVTALAVPALALALYFVSGAQPNLPSSDGPEARQIQEAALIDLLRHRLSQMEPGSERSREGYKLLGRAEESRRNFAQAAKDYRMALTGKFDPVIALHAAESSVQAEGRVSPSSADLYRQALAAVPDAPWRKLAEERLQQSARP